MISQFFLYFFERYFEFDFFYFQIRIIGVLSVKSDSSDLTCYYKFPLSNENAEIDYEIQAAPAIAVHFIAASENFDMTYSAAFVLCNMIVREDGRLPLQVTFSSHSERSYEELERVDFVDVHYTNRTENSHQEKFMTVCGQTLHHNYNKYLALIEFVEFYLMMGVNHFTFYNTSSSSEVNKVLSYYESLGIVTVLQWKLPSIYAFERNLR